MQRPIRTEREADDQLMRQATPKMGVDRIVTIVAEHEIVALGNAHGRHRVIHGSNDPRFRLRYAVDHKPPATDAYLVAADSNNTLDAAQVALRQRRHHEKQRLGRAEADYVATPCESKALRDLIEQQQVACFECGFH